MNPSATGFAIVRPVPSSYDHCVRTNNAEKINVELARFQHAQYCKALQRLGLKLVWIERADSLPDSCFVEDAALILGEKTVVCNMRVRSRVPEVVGVAKVLERLRQVCYIKSPATIDGGDALKAEDRIFVGLSARTNSEAASQLKQILEDTNLRVIPVKVRKVLRLKSACTYLGNKCVVVSPGDFDTAVLSGLRKIMVPKGEEYAADCLAIDATVLMAKGYPKTKKLIEDEGFRVEELEVSEFRKGDGALTCLSIVL